MKAHSELIIEQQVVLKQSCFGLLVTDMWQQLLRQLILALVLATGNGTA